MKHLAIHTQLKTHKYDQQVVLTLFYDPEINRFIDEDGKVIHDIYRFVTPGQVMIFKKFKNMYVNPDVTRSFLVELIYPEETN